MARLVPEGTDFDGWIQTTNAIATDFGDITTWTESEDDNLVDIVKWINVKVDGISIEQLFTIPNNQYFLGTNFGGGTTNVFKFNADDKLEFNSNLDILGVKIVSGTISGLTTPLAIADGGTGGGTQEAAQTALGLLPGTDVQAYDAALQNISDITGQSDKSVIVYVTDTWVARSGATLRSDLGLAIGTNVQAYSTRLAEISALTPTNESFIVGSGSAYVTKTKAEVKTLLNLQETSTNLQQFSALSGMGDAATLFYSTDSSSWITKTPSEARLALGLTIGSQVQAYSGVLNTIAGLAGLSEDDFLVYKSGAWSNQTKASVKSILSLGSLAYLSSITGAYFTGTLSTAKGGTGSGNVDTARGNLNAAKSAANSDITSLTACTSITSSAGVTIGGNAAGLLTLRTVGVDAWKLFADGSFAPLSTYNIGNTTNRIRHIYMDSTGTISRQGAPDYTASGWSIVRTYNNAAPDLTALGNAFCTLLSDLVSFGILQ